MYIDLYNYIYRERKRIGKKTFFTLCHHSFENPFLLPFLITLPLPLSSPQLQPRHHNRDNFLWHHIIVNIFSMEQVMPKHLSHKPSLTFSYQLPKIYLHIRNKQSLIKHYIFDLNSLPAFLLQLYSLHHLIISSHMRKTQRTVSVWKSLWRWNKAKEISHI